MPASLLIGIDVGGTNTKFGVCDVDGRILASDSLATQPPDGPARLAERVAIAVDALMTANSLDRSRVGAVGVGAPGPVDNRAGVLRCAPNMSGWDHDIPLAEIFGAHFRHPVNIENDANAAAFGEYFAGAGRGVPSMLMLTLGTGLGSGIVLDGGLWRGDHGAGAEAGHMILVPDGRECPCGQRGCFERYVSATAVADRYRERAALHPESAWLQKFRAACGMPDAPIGGLPLTSAHVNMARNDDPLAADVWDETCRYLAIGCISLMRLLDVRRIVLGGGLAEAGDALLEPTRRHYAHANWHVTRDKPEMVSAAAGIDAGVIGNAALARKMASM